MAHSSNAVAIAVAVARREAARNDGGVGAVCLLACVGEDAALAVSRCVYVLVARLRIALHYHLDEVSVVDELRWFWCSSGGVCGEGIQPVTEKAQREAR